MNEKTEIIFMQTRLIRLAAKNIINLFKKADVLDYIESGYGIFHCEGDEAVLEDVSEYLKRKGVSKI